MNTQTPTWNGSKGSVAVTAMATPHLQNAIAKVTGELAESTVTNADAKREILTALQAELSTRTDIDGARATA